MSAGRPQSVAANPRRWPLAPCIGCGERFRTLWRDRDGLCGGCVDGVKRDAYERLMRSGEVVYAIGSRTGA